MNSIYNVEKFKKNGYKLVGKRSNCDSMKKAMNDLGFNTRSKYVDTKWLKWKQKGAKTSPTIVHKGKIVAESKEGGGGSVFSLILPFKPSRTDGH